MTRQEVIDMTNKHELIKRKNKEWIDAISSGNKDKLNKLSEENFKEYEEWENSIEGVLYALQVWGVCTPKDEKLIAETLLKLSKEIREKVLDYVDGVIFVVMTQAAGEFHYHNLIKLISKGNVEERIAKAKKTKTKNVRIEIRQPFIFLNLDKRMKKSQKMDTIAHEIAHFILDHDEMHTIPKGAKINRYEKEADDLTEKWGFNRTHKSYKR